MKKMNLIICVVFLLIGFCACSYFERIYTRNDVKVVFADEKNVTFEDRHGNLWQWELEKGESFFVGERVKLVMDINNTIDTTEDDIIKRIIVVEK